MRQVILRAKLPELFLPLLLLIPFWTSEQQADATTWKTFFPLIITWLGILPLALRNDPSSRFFDKATLFVCGSLLIQMFFSSYAAIQSSSYAETITLTTGILLWRCIFTLPFCFSQNKKDSLPDTVESAFLEAGPRVEEILKNSPTPLLVQEVGGYLAGYTHQLASYPHFKGIVEDTNNGHWRYENAGEHITPVVSMAQSPIKDIEDTVIGDSVVYSTERIFREEFHAVIQGLRSGVIGYGKIGTSTSIALKGRESPVAVYDIDPCKCIRARFEGLRIFPLEKLLSESELIIGCTGKTSIREENIPFIRDQAVLVSGSAKNEEFDLSAFDRVCKKEIISSVVWRYIQPDGRSFYVFNQGTPVNFRDRSILGFILDMIYSELFLCMKHIANESVPHGLQHSPTVIHTEVARTWLQIYESEFSNNEDDKVWSFPESLGHALTHTFHLQTQTALSLNAS